jgi:hypothetical protein
VVQLEEIYPTCEQCPANLKRAFGIRRAIGCQAYITIPLDDFAERILHETLIENAKGDRAQTEQSNLLRALVASTPANGKTWESESGANSVRSRVAGGGWGTRAVGVSLDQSRADVTVYALLELLFMYPMFPARAVEDILLFFRSFFAVVASYVSTPEGKLDQRRNELFWGRSPSLNELNLYMQLLKHATRLGSGISVLPD